MSAFCFGRFQNEPQELAARAFEAFVQDHPTKNSFLVQGTKQSVEAKLGIYPQGHERRLIADAFLDYFSILGRALKHQAK